MRFSAEKITGEGELGKACLSACVYKRPEWEGGGGSYKMSASFIGRLRVKRWPRTTRHILVLQPGLKWLVCDHGRIMSGTLTAANVVDTAFEDG